VTERPFYVALTRRKRNEVPFTWQKRSLSVVSRT